MARILKEEKCACDKKREKILEILIQLQEIAIMFLTECTP